MKFCDIAIATQAPDSIRETDLKMLYANKIKKGLLWVGRCSLSCVYVIRDRQIVGLYNGFSSQDEPVVGVNPL